MRRYRSLHVSNVTKGHSYINMRQKVNFLLQPNAFLQKSITDYKAPKKSLSASKLFLSIELRRRPHSLTYLAYRSPFQRPHNLLPIRKTPYIQTYLQCSVRGLDLCLSVCWSLVWNPIGTSTLAVDRTLTKTGSSIAEA